MPKPQVFPSLTLGKISGILKEACKTKVRRERKEIVATMKIVRRCGTWDKSSR
jgi:hypothetical protein